jgi:predicted MFS family arabinose efflux permease
VKLSPRQPQAPFGPAYVWYVVCLLALVNVFNYMDRMALSVLLPFIKADLSLSDSQLGLLIGFAFSIFYALCGIPIARWADRGVRRDIIAIAIATWSVMTALSGAAQNFWHLAIARVGVGVGEAGCLPPAQSLVCDYVPLQRRAGVFAINTFGLGIGLMIGMALAGAMGDTIGWRWTFLALGLPGLVCALLVRLTLREPRRGYFDDLRVRTSPQPLREAFRILSHSRSYVLLTSYLIVNGFVNLGLAQWWPSLYARVFALPVTTVGIYLGVAIGIGSGAGLLIGGVLANRVAARAPSLPLLIGAGMMVLTLPVAVASVFVSSPFVSMALVLLTVLMWSVPYAPAMATLYSVTEPHMRATAGAVAILLTAILGSGLGPFCVGVVSDALAADFGSSALRFALLLPIGLLPVAAAFLYAAGKALQKELARTDSEAAQPKPKLERLGIQVDAGGCKNAATHAKSRLS